MSPFATPLTAPLLGAAAKFQKRSGCKTRFSHRTIHCSQYMSPGRSGLGFSSSFRAKRSALFWAPVNVLAVKGSHVMSTRSRFIWIYTVKVSHEVLIAIENGTYYI